MQLRGTKIVVDSVNAKTNIISGSGATASLSENQSGSTVLFDRAAGIVYTLPAAASVGTKYNFVVSTTITSNAAKIITGVGTELLIGSLVNIDTDTSNAVAAWTANGSTHVAISMNGTTTGAISGTNFVVEKVSSTQWVVKGTVHGSGTVATPFATS